MALWWGGLRCKANDERVPNKRFSTGVEGLVPEQNDSCTRPSWPQCYQGYGVPGANASMITVKDGLWEDSPAVFASVLVIS